MRESWGLSRIYGMRDWCRIVRMRHLFFYIRQGRADTVFTERRDGDY
ncbi:hypothetical protein Lalb_Chr01g0012911 [Lupinus albus]|uniref:Uncharacterized protein n=1 Tax=Lupinus albus TaxID=3870 RepID=A0A6A4R352_LUPAL|nr:hypothetical protein Lalb_Chr01g0012911 [Lupinus albus]